MFEREVVDLATAVVDGDNVDWPSARARLTSPNDRQIVRGLETVSQLRKDSLQAAHPQRYSLPPLLKAARLIAIVCSAVGLAGFVPLLRGPQPFRYTILVAILVAFGATGAYLDLGGQDRRSRALAACNWTSSASFAARGVFQLTRLWPRSVSLQAILALRPEALFAAALWQFAGDFPAVTRFSRIDRVCRPGLRLALAVGAALFVANIVPFVMPGSRIVTAVAPFQRLTGDGPLFWSLVFGVALPALFVMAWRGRSSGEHERARVRFFLYGVTGGFAPIMIEVFLEGLFPAYARLMRTPRWTLWSSLVVYPPLFLVPIVTAYAVMAENVLGVRVVVQQGLRYLLARWLLMWGAAIPVTLLLATVYRHANEPLNVTLSKPPGIILLWFAAAGVAVLAFRQSLVGLLDRWALPGAQSSSAMLAQMSDRLKHARTPLEAASTLAQAAERALQTRASMYLCLNERVIATADGLDPPYPSLLGVLLNGSREPCIVGPSSERTYFRLLGDADRRWIQEEQIQVIVPLLANRRSDGVLAFVALRSRRNALAFSEDDLRFLRAGAAAASLACEAIVSKAVPGPNAAAIEEVGAECTACGRVDTWKPDARMCSCGGPQEPAVLPQEVLSRFRIIRRLGAGGMGVVYHAADVTLGRDVAVKTLPRLSDDAVARIMAEARVMAKLAHSDVAVLYSAERWRDTPLLIMEYLSGGTLATRLRDGALAVGEAVKITHVLALALVRVHGANLYHGDIKPSNIGFAADGMPKLLDFGLARAAYESNAADDRLIGGTPAYLSPEVRAGDLPGPRLDLWALALVLGEMLLGTHLCPDAQNDDDIARGVKIAMSRLRPSMPPDLCTLLQNALSLSPDDRPLSASALSAALATIERSTSAP